MRTNSLILLIFIGLFCIGCSRKIDVIKIGAVLPLTGNSAIWGVPTKEGIEIASDKLNESGGINGKKVEVIFEDSKGDPSSGVSAIRKLIEVDNVKAVLDNSNSAVTLAMAPIAEKNKVILMVTGASAPAIADAGEYIFRIWNSDVLEGELIANYVYDSLKSRRSAILLANNSYGKGLENIYKKIFISRTGIVLASESFDPNAADFRTQINKVLQTTPDVIYLICYPNQGATLLRQLKELGNKSRLVGAVAFEDADMLLKAGTTADGLLYPLPAPVDTNQVEYSEFKKRYDAKFHKQLPFLADVGYDGFNVLAEAMKNNRYNYPDSIKEGLDHLPEYNGVSGVIKFDLKGEVHKPFGIREVKDGKAFWRIAILH